MAQAGLRLSKQDIDTRHSERVRVLGWLVHYTSTPSSEPGQTVGIG